MGGGYPYFPWEMLVEEHPMVTLPETNSKFAPEFMDGWKLEDDPFLLGERPIFRGYVPVSFRECNLDDS